MAQALKLATLVTSGPGQYRLQGTITFRDQPPEALWRAPLAPAEGRAVVDLSGLDHSDSVALALLVEWDRLASLGGYQLRVVHVPERLQDLIRVYGLTKLFGPA
ncbi:MAG TPA: STAS domain-containing protein [Acidiferrobacter sp.]|nr:STAS domain-containing protein [Acidiferrobacter sp.]